MLVFGAIVLGIALCAVAANKYLTHLPPSAEFQVRSVVSGFGDEISQVSLSTTTEAIATAMDEHYSLYIHPDLLASWKTHPETALGLESIEGKPDRINIDNVSRSAGNTYVIDGVITTRWNAHASSTMPGNVPVRFILSLGPDGWQITSYEPRAIAP